MSEKNDKIEQQSLSPMNDNDGKSDTRLDGRPCN